MAQAKRDDNYVTTLLAVSSSDEVTPVVLWADPTTHRLLVSGSSFADQETPTGTINGTNVTFTLANTPSPAGSLQLFLNGVIMERGAGKDYTTSTVTITFATAPQTSSILLAWYRY